MHALYRYVIAFEIKSSGKQAFRYAEHFSKTPIQSINDFTGEMSTYEKIHSWHLVSMEVEQDDLQDILEIASSIAATQREKELEQQRRLVAKKNAIEATYVEQAKEWARTHLSDILPEQYWRYLEFPKNDDEMFVLSLPQCYPISFFPRIPYYGGYGSHPYRSPQYWGDSVGIVRVPYEVEKDDFWQQVFHSKGNASLAEGIQSGRSEWLKRKGQKTNY